MPMPPPKPSTEGRRDRQVTHEMGQLTRAVQRNGNVSVPVRYDGVLPDPFRAGREVIVDVRKQGHTFVGEKDSLVTKCPSKFTAEKT